MAFDLFFGKTTLWLEIGGGTDAQIRNVAHALLNRQKSGRWGKTLSEVCLTGAAFSCWNALLTVDGKAHSNPDRMRLARASDSDPGFARCEAILRTATSETADPTHGAMFYYAKDSAMPEWAQGKTPCLDDGVHLYFNNVK